MSEPTGETRRAPSRPRHTVVDDGRAVVVHPRRWSAALFLLAAAWNGLGAWWSRGADPVFTMMALVGVVLFAYLAARARADVFVRFEDGRLSVRPRPLFAISRPDLELPMVDIESFVAGKDDEHDCEGHAVFAVLKAGGAKKRVPLPLAGVVLRSRGARRPFVGGVSSDEARAVADAMNDALDTARRSATHYRVMAGAVPGPVAARARVPDGEPADEPTNDAGGEEPAGRGATRMPGSP